MMCCFFAVVKFWFAVISDFGFGRDGATGLLLLANGVVRIDELSRF